MNCSVDDCDTDVLARSYCRLHYDRWRRTGSPHLVRMRKDYRIDDGGRECIRCKQYLTWDSFYEKDTGARGFFPVCKSCHCTETIQRKRRTRYGLDSIAYDSLLESQDHQCGICGSSRKLYVDHNHATGAVRGFLCNQCNAGIGMLQDNPDLLRKAIEWLEKDSNVISA